MKSPKELWNIFCFGWLQIKLKELWTNVIDDFLRYEENFIRTKK